jgi:hypothetical protein
MVRGEGVPATTTCSPVGQRNYPKPRRIAIRAVAPLAISGGQG